MTASDPKRCNRHDPREYISQKVGNEYRVTCGRCGAFLGFHDEKTEQDNRKVRR